MSRPRRWVIAAVAFTATLGAAFVGVPGAPATAEPVPTVQEPAPLPPLGWNSWNTFYCNINETMIRQTADAMVSSGMAAAGYQYVVVDDCWMQDRRDSSGNLQARTDRFPSGMKALGDYIHSKGLKFGIYHAPREKTCNQYFSNLPGTSSYGYETRDANLFASWGVDFVKHDWCDPRDNAQTQAAVFKKFQDALKATGRPIVLSINPNSAHSNTAPTYSGWGAVSDMWRTSEDLSASWSTGCAPSNDCFVGITEALDIIEPMREWTKPGQYNDPDMLMVGVRNALTATENRSHQSMWAMFSAPLIAGNDLRNMSADVRAILTNRDVLALDQDPLVRQADRVRDDGNLEVWAKPLADGSVAVALLNRGTGTQRITTNLAQVGLRSGTHTYKELWTGATGTTTGDISAQVVSHGVALYRVTPSGGTPSSPPVSSAPSSTGPDPAGACSATYTVTGQWNGGFQGEVKVTAGSRPVSSWQVSWSFPNGQTITQAWNARVTSSGSAITATNVDYNGTLGSGASASFGFLGAGSPVPTSLNLTCTAT
ncbi:cellulose binding domain-containing protein [Actinoplanes xinjiangensis]|uniref:cellulose binding domain-containing protein n=1 Tax=Actinoplanes xinjiangensis TaxID=512350 RepID=UPI003418FA67